MPKKAKIKKRSIVIVDDEDDIRMLLKDAFLSEGFDVHMAENGLRLIAILRSEDIDCILLDINMPWLSGYQICRSIKSDENLKHIKVIYISGLIRNEEECYSTGCDGIIKKPFSIQDAIKSVNDLLDRKH